MAAYVTKSQLRLEPAARCGKCDTRRPLERVMVTPAGPVCDVCTIGAESDHNARLAARDDVTTGMRFAFAASFAVLVAVLLSGPIPALAEPLASVPATGASAGLATNSLVWGLWAMKTGGYGRIAPGTTWLSMVRASGGIAAVSGAIAGLVALALAAMPWFRLVF